MRQHDRTLRLLVGAYRILLRAYPSEFRERFGAEMLFVFRATVSGRLDARGIAAVPGVIAHLVHDWCNSVVKEHNDMTRAIRLGRWAATLPLAILASYAVQELIGVAFRRFTADVGMPTLIASLPARVVMDAYVSAGSFAMSAAFVATALLVAPERKASVGRIALAVVGAFGLAAIAMGAFRFAISPAMFGMCILAGGVAAYLPWRGRAFRSTASA
jgi:hypothetical protein